MNCFPLPLHGAPVVFGAGVGRHGAANRAITERYRLPSLWCLHFYFYEAQLLLGENASVTVAIRSGSVSLVPPNVPLCYKFQGEATHFYAHFSLSSALEAGPQRGRFWYESHEIPPDFSRGFERLIAAHSDLRHGAQHSVRCGVGVWELLWQLAAITSSGEENGAWHPALQKAATLIESQLSQPLGIAELAREVGLCHNHLTRLFVKHTGQTPIAFIRRRRALRAQHLLQNSTLPIKSIAAQVGVFNLGQFNHLLRRELGVSPRACRISLQNSATIERQKEAVSDQNS